VRVRKWLVPVGRGVYRECMDAILGLDRQALDRVRRSRDQRFDGKVFIAITSTRIYCRPICPSPTSNECNVRYYATAAAAEHAGFRPCLRCRPEAAPGTPGWHGTSAVVRRTLRLIEDGALDDGSVDALAARVGLGPRHLHRLFVQHVGASPVAVAQTRRLHFAKRLLDDTTLPITEIALAAGFGSVRRFNHAFRQTWHCAPRDLRGKRGHPSGPVLADDIVLRLAFRPPYDWRQVCDFLAARAVPGVERVDAHSYARTVRSGAGHAILRVREPAGANALELRVSGAAPASLYDLSSATRRMFDVAADPASIASAFAHDALLAPLVDHRPGVRIPGAWDPFECAVRAVLGEDRDSDTARALAGRLVARCGKPVADATDGLAFLFPAPCALAAADLSGLGIDDARIAALRALARAAIEGALDLEAGACAATASLVRAAGLDPDTALYVALRALGDPDAFPVTGAARDAARGLPPDALGARAETWRPWRGYAVALLWAAGDAGEAVITVPAPRAVRAAAATAHARRPAAASPEVRSARP
jgi:AraC family transcriptional regulator, regulatory protein of adaptative response / DNA-3-methyladenine glycosylase II